MADTTTANPAQGRAAVDQTPDPDAIDRAPATERGSKMPSMPGTTMDPKKMIGFAAAAGAIMFTVLALVPRLMVWPFKVVSMRRVSIPVPPSMRMGVVEAVLTVETGSADREANMWEFARRALALLAGCLRETRPDQLR